jgi:hypothetical protein
VSVALNGNLQDFGISEIFQLISQQRKTGLLEINENHARMRMAFDEGAVVWAAPSGRRDEEALGQQLIRCGLITQQNLEALLIESEASARSLSVLIRSHEMLSDKDLEEIGDLLTQDTIFNVLCWSSGSFHFSAKPIQHDRAPEKLLGAEQILMDGLRMVDEWQTFSGRIPAGDTVLENRGSVEVVSQVSRNDLRCPPEQATRIVTLIDGRLSLQRVVDLSRLGVFEANRVIAELLEHGLIAPLAPGPGRGRAAQRKPELRRSLGDKLRWVAVASIPPLLLGLVVSLLALRVQSRPIGIESFPIERPALAEVRAAFEKRRIRNALEARRLLRGEFPESLSQTDRSSWLNEASLTPASGPAYYYRNRGDDIVLLSPRR